MGKIKTLIIIALALFWAIGFSQEAPFQFREQGSLFFVSSYPEGRTLNSICAFRGIGGDDARFYAVGDSGILVKMKGLDRRRVIPNFPRGWYDLDVDVRTLDRNFNLTGVWFADSMNGWCVGYRNNGSDTGAIWKTTNGGDSWIRVESRFLPTFPIPIRFLNIHGYNRLNLWVSCANGYVLRTTNGGAYWWLPPNPKPGGQYDFTSFRAIRTFSNANTCWVAGDETGLIAKTTDGGNTWIRYFPFPDSKYVYSDIHHYDPDDVYFAASRSAIVWYNGVDWNTVYPLPGRNQYVKEVWWRGLEMKGLAEYCAGTGSIKAWPNLSYGTFGPGEQDYPYDCNDLAYIEDDSGTKWLVAVGTPRTIHGIPHLNIPYIYNYPYHDVGIELWDIEADDDKPNNQSVMIK